MCKSRVICVHILTSNRLLMDDGAIEYVKRAWTLRQKAKSIEEKSGSRRVEGKPRTASERISDTAEFYGYSERRFVDMIKKGEVLGISYKDGVYEFECEPFEVRGTITDRPRVIVLPKGSQRISVSVVRSSPVKGAVYYSIRQSNSKRLSMEIQAQPGRSGMLVSIHVSPNRITVDQLPRIVDALSARLNRPDYSSAASSQGKSAPASSAKRTGRRRS